MKHSSKTHPYGVLDWDLPRQAAGDKCYPLDPKERDPAGLQCRAVGPTEALVIMHSLWLQ